MPLSWQLGEVLENRLLDRWSSLLDRSPGQINRFHHADAELIPIPDHDGLLAITVDTIEEEISLGFYREPETIGWMGATACLSDLAAVGAQPLGLVISVSLPGDRPEDFQARLATGLNGACRRAGTHVLGGDTNTSDQASITGCAIGIVSGDRALTRVGCSAGDRLFVTGRLGLGSLAATGAILALPPELYREEMYRPEARLREGAFVAQYAGCAMDTSDGLVATLDQLGRLNRVGFSLDLPVDDLLAESVRVANQTLQVPSLALLSGLHGEFELLFTVPEGEVDRFQLAAREAGLAFLPIGRATAELELRLVSGEDRVVDGAAIRNLAEQYGNDLQRYLTELIRLTGPQSTPA